MYGLVQAHVRNDSTTARNEPVEDSHDQNENANKECKRLYVCRAQKKFEREAELRKKFSRIRREQAGRQEGLNLYVKNLTPYAKSGQLPLHFAPVGKVMLEFACYTTRAELSMLGENMNHKLLVSK